MDRLRAKYNSMSVETKAALWFAMCNFINKGIAMIVVPLYTRMLTTEEYGMYTVFQSWLNIFIIIATLEISRGHYKVGITKYDEDVDNYTISVLGLSNIVTILFIVIYLCAIPVFNNLLEMPTYLVLSMFGYLLVYPAWEFWIKISRSCFRAMRCPASFNSVSFNSFSCSSCKVRNWFTCRRKEVPRLFVSVL